MNKGVDGGAVWKKIDIGKDYSQPLAIAFRPAAAYSVNVTCLTLDRSTFMLSSDDGGAYWNGKVIQNELFMLYSLEYDRNNPDILVVGGVARKTGGSGCVFISEDNGRNWKNSTNNLKISTISNIALSTPQIIYCAPGSGSAGLETGVFKTIDGGSSWNHIGLSNAHYIKIHPHDQNTVFVGTKEGVFVSYDAGGKWEEMTGGEKITTIEKLDVHPKNPTRLYAAALEGAFVTDIATNIGLNPRYNDKKPEISIVSSEKSKLTVTYNAVDDNISSVELFDAMGKEVRIKTDRVRFTGSKTTFVCSIGSVNNLYFCSITTAAGYIITRKILIAR
ncbi:MAG: hypothetical protein JW795_13255 [Chitinivibrionales bacterium]|nr:hypothetical protein [Chitinivibrionales bacterium]